MMLRDFVIAFALYVAAVVATVALLARCEPSASAQEWPTATPAPAEPYAQGSIADVNGTGTVDVIDLLWVALHAGWTGPRTECADFQVPAATATPTGPRFVLVMTAPEVDKLVSGEIRVIRACP